MFIPAIVATTAMRSQVPNTAQVIATTETSTRLLFNLSIEMYGLLATILTTPLLNAKLVYQI